MVGSQLVGLVPLKALLDAAAFYCDKEKLFVLEEEHRIRLVGCACLGCQGRHGGCRPSAAPGASSCFQMGPPQIPNPLLPSVPLFY